MRRALALAITVIAASAAPVSAQQSLPDVLDTLAALWARADAAGIARLSATSGVELELGGLAVGPLDGRKFSAALRRVFDNRATVSVVANMTSAVAGVEDRAFGELTWELRPGGARAKERSTVFLALVREPAGWRVTQIRILE